MINIEISDGQARRSHASGMRKVRAPQGRDDR